MEAISCTDGSQPAHPKVISLGRLEKTLISGSFLAQVASGLSSFSLLLYPLVNALSGVGPTPVLLFSVLFVFFLPFMWSCAIAYMWRRAVFFIPVIPCLVIAGMEIDFRYDYFFRSFPDPGGNLVFSVALTLLALLLPGLVIWRILADSFWLSQIPDEMRELFIVIDPQRRGFTQAFAAALGIHPVCRWLPIGRRLIAGTLFVLAASFGGAGILAVMVWFLRTGPGAAISGAFGGVLFYSAIVGTFRYLARRCARISAEKLAQVDHRPPILFLRSFKEDQVSLDRPKRGFIRYWVGIGAPSSKLDHLLLEESTSLGPVIAIGVPGAPPPFGAARTYVEASEWQNVVARLARDATAIVIVVDHAEGVQWELSHIRDSGYLPKTLCLLPPRFATRSQNAAELVRRALLDNRSVLTEPLSEACIGWYRTSGGEMVLLVTSRPNQASYLCALRLFRRRNFNRRDFRHGWVIEQKLFCCGA